jgi:hypothetical protein
MHTYKKSKGEALWTVGHYERHSNEDGTWDQWVPMHDFASVETAAAFVNYLNGGTGEGRKNMEGQDKIIP